MIDYVRHLRADSARFASLIRNPGPTTPVPSCPDWTMPDLAWHLAEVQYFWASIVADLLDTPDSVSELERPDDEHLPDLFESQSQRLVNALESHPDNATCWSWHDGGNNVGWVRRRQAHEALIHRVDAELTVASPSPVNSELAIDGVDEILTVMLDCSTIPEWSSFDPDGRTALITAADGPSWGMSLGRFVGTSPASGTSYDDPALLLGPVSQNPSVAISATAANLDLWLWGRGPMDLLEVVGDVDAARAIRSAAVAATQ